MARNMICCGKGAFGSPWRSRPGWVYDSRDTFKETHCALHNITERKIIEEALRDSQEQLKLLFEYAPDAYFLNDVNGNLVNGNLAAEQLTGYSREEFVGQNFFGLGLFEASQTAKAEAALELNQRMQPAGPEEYALRRKDRAKWKSRCARFRWRLRTRP